MKFTAAPSSQKLALLAMLSLPAACQASADGQRQTPPAEAAQAAPRSHAPQPPEWLSALPAPVVPAAHAAALPMPDELLLAFAGLGVAAVGLRLRRRG
jgi:hypothetical protein